MTGYRFPTSNRKPAQQKPAKHSVEYPDTTKEVKTPIQGQIPASIHEWRIAKGLYIMGRTFIYQYAFRGGAVSGGQIVDFMLTDRPKWQPVFMDGEAWHNNVNAARDDFKRAQLMDGMRGRINKPIVIMDFEVTSITVGLSVLRRKL